MEDGYIQQVGTPSEVYQNPVNIFVAQFIGAPSMNMLPGKKSDIGVVLDTGPTIPLNLNTEATNIMVGIRPNDLIPAKDDELALFEGTVKIIEPLGPETLVYVDLYDCEVLATVPGRAVPKIGDKIRLKAPEEEIHFFNADTGVVIQ
jgi:multiple sugar transport system ATP-binding protein